MENQNAGVPPVEKAPEVTPPATSQADESELSLKLKALEAENTKLSIEKENYRKGMLLAKGKIEEPEDNVPDVLEELVERKINERFFNQKETELARQKEEILQKALAENNELRRAINNPTPAGNGAGSNQDKLDVDNNYGFTPEFLAMIKSKGLDPAQVKKNMTGYTSPTPLQPES